MRAAGRECGDATIFLRFFIKNLYKSPEAAGQEARVGFEGGFV
jgi:hypothetical protein